MLFGCLVMCVCIIRRVFASSVRVLLARRASAALTDTRAHHPCEESTAHIPREAVMSHVAFGRDLCVLSVLWKCGEVGAEQC